MDNHVFSDTDFLAQVSSQQEVSDEPDNNDPEFRKPKKLRQKRTIIIAACALLGVVLIVSLSFLAYKLLSHEKYDDSAAFYFSSDLLNQDGGDFVAYGTIDFNIYNYADSLRISREPVENFEIKVSCGGKDITGKTDISMGETAMEPNVRCACGVSISVPDEYMNEALSVSVTSYPIEKVIRGTFTLKPKWGYEIQDASGNACAQLVLYANKDVNLEVSWDSETLIADSTNSYVREAEAGENKCVVQLSGGMSAMIPMFKTDIKKDYSDNGKVITVTESALASESDKKSESDVAKSADSGSSFEVGTNNQEET